MFPDFGQVTKRYKVAADKAIKEIKDMSVRTDADEALDRVDDNMQEIISDLSKIISKDTWGAGDYTEDYIDELAEIMIQVMKLKRKLGR